MVAGTECPGFLYVLLVGSWWRSASFFVDGSMASQKGLTFLLDII